MIDLHTVRRPLRAGILATGRRSDVRRVMGAVLVIAADELRRIAYWSHDLNATELERARSGVVEKTFPKGAYVCHRGDMMEPWTGVVSGIVKVGTVSHSGKSISLAGMRPYGWFGEGSVLKNEPRQYDIVALRDTRMALMNRATFLWLFDNSAAFNRFLVWQLNARLGQFIALLEHDRMLEGRARLARSIAWLFHPVLYPDAGTHLEVTQEEIGELAGQSRQAANKGLSELEAEGLIRVERTGITVLNLERLRRYGD